MIISDTRQFVFLHNPKCAGTTVRETLARFDTTGNLFWMYDEWNGVKFDKAHAPLFLMQQKYPAYFERLQRYFVFSFVRNPYERVVSAFGEVDRDFIKTCQATNDRKTYVAMINSFVKSIRPEHVNGLFFPLRHFVLQKNIMFIGRKRYADIVMALEDWPRCLLQLKSFDPVLAQDLAAAEAKNTRKLDFGTFEDLLEPSTLRHCYDLYAEDFEVFGYDRADGQLKPMAQAPQLSVA
jgi:hypothetical protein